MAEISIQNVQWKLAENQTIKGLVHKFFLSFTHHHVVPNLYDFRYFNVKRTVFVTIKVNVWT